MIFEKFFGRRADPSIPSSRRAAILHDFTALDRANPNAEEAFWEDVSQKLYADYSHTMHTDDVTRLVDALRTEAQTINTASSVGAHLVDNPDAAALGGFDRNTQQPQQIQRPFDPRTQSTWSEAEKRAFDQEWAQKAEQRSAIAQEQVQKEQAEATAASADVRTSASSAMVDRVSEHPSDAHTTIDQSSVQDRQDLVTDDGEHDKIDAEMQRRVVRGAALLEAYRRKYATQPQELHGSENNKVDMEHATRGRHVFDAETEDRTQDVQRRRWWSKVFSKKGIKKLIAAITFGSLVASQGAMAQSVYTNRGRRGEIPHLAQTSKVSTTEEERSERQSRYVELGPVKSGDVVGEIIRQYLEQKGFLVGIPSGQRVAQFIDRILKKEEQLVQGQWKKTGIASGNVDRIDIGEKIKFATLADVALLQQWQEELREDGDSTARTQEQARQKRPAPQPENFEDVVVQQPDVTQASIQSQDNVVQRGGGESVFASQSPYQTGEQRVTVEGVTIENDNAVLGRNIRLLTERVLGRDAVYKTPVASKTIGEVIAGSEDPQRTKQIFDHMSAAAGISYDPEKTKTAVFMARVALANKMEEAVMAAQQEEVSASQQPSASRDAQSITSIQEEQQVEADGNSASRHFDQQFRVQSFMEQSLTETRAYQDFLKWVSDAAYRDFIARNQGRSQAQSEWDQQVERYYDSYVKRAQQEIRAQQRQAVESVTRDAERREKQVEYMAKLHEQTMQHPHFPKLLAANKQLQDLFHRYASTLKHVMDPKDFAQMTEGNPYVEQWVTKARGPLTDDEVQQLTLASLPHINTAQSSFGVVRPSHIPQEVLEQHDRNIATNAARKTGESMMQIEQAIQVTTAQINAVIAEIEKVLKRNISSTN